MKFKEAIKRIRQETAPATYMPDFDKEECLKIIEEEYENLRLRNRKLEGEIAKYKSYMFKWQDQLKVDGVNSKGMVLNDIQYLIKRDV